MNRKSLKQRLISFILVLIMAIGILPLSAGNVTADDSIPANAIHIKTAEELAIIGGSQSAGKYYVLDNDINLVDEWVPINDFRGTFDGQGYSVNNLYILESSQRQYAGLFGEIRSYLVTIKNVGVNIGTQGISTSSDGSQAGGLIGLCFSYGEVNILNCYSTGEVSVFNNSNYVSSAGGLIGACYLDNNGEILISDCYSTSKVHSSTYYAGGLIGNCNSHRGTTITILNSCATGDVSTSTSNYNYSAGGLIGKYDENKIINANGSMILSHCYATGNVSASTAGGLIGDCSGESATTIKSCYATGNVSALGMEDTVRAGGLIGYCLLPTVSNCYATGEVYTSTTSSIRASCAGGLIGQSGNSANAPTISNCYAIGSRISASAPVYSQYCYAGGLIGHDNGEKIISCYRLSTQIITGNNVNTNGIRITPEQMRTQSYFNDWDFNTVWEYKDGVNNNYPILRMLGDPITSVSDVMLNKSITEIELGNSETLIATVNPYNATNKGVTWSSNNNYVATVDNDGKVTAISLGTATITVTTIDGMKTNSCIVTVVIPVTGITLNKNTITIIEGKTETLTANISPYNATNKNVMWSSNNDSVATVDNDGKITAISVGTAIITVKTIDGEKIANCTVTVKIDDGLPLNTVYIKTEEQLASIVGGSSSTGRYYILENNINLTKEWVPINGFNGIFDGRGYSINNLYVLESSQRQYAGLFGSASSATIKNLGVNIAEQGISAYSYTNSASTSHAGGFIGLGNGTIVIENSYVTGNISVSEGSETSSYVFYSSAGGLIGHCGGTNTIQNSSSSVTISNSYATSNVSVRTSTSGTGTASSSSSATGGLIGYGDNVTITNSYATGNVYSASRAHSYAGGLIGRRRTTISIENSYATGDVLASSSYPYNPSDGSYLTNAGGLGILPASAINSSYRISTQNITGIGKNTFGTPLTNQQMHNQSSFVGWDFNSVWEIRDDYLCPQLRGLPPAGLPNMNISDGLEIQTTLKIEVGDVYSLVAYLRDENIDWGTSGQDSRRSTWTSSNTSVVTLNPTESMFVGGIATGDGIIRSGSDSVAVTGVSVGTSTVTVQLKDGRTVSCVVTVTEKTNTGGGDDFDITSEDNKNRVLSWTEYFMDDLIYLHNSLNFMSTHYSLIHDTSLFLVFDEMFTAPLFNGYGPINTIRYYTSDISIQNAEEILVELLKESEDFYNAYKDETANNLLKTAYKTYIDGLKLYIKGTGMAIEDTVQKVLNESLDFSKYTDNVDFSEIKKTLIDNMPADKVPEMQSLLNAYEMSETIKSVFEVFDCIKTVTEITGDMLDFVDKFIEIESLKQADEVYIEALNYISTNCEYPVVAQAAKNLSTKISNDLYKNISDLGTQIAIYASDKLSSIALDEFIKFIDKTVFEGLPILEILKKGMDYSVLISNTFFHAKDLSNLHDALRSMFWIGETINKFSKEKFSQFRISQTETNASDVVVAYKLLWKCRVTSENTLKNICEILDFKDGVNIIDNNLERVKLIKYNLFQYPYEWLKRDSSLVLAIAQCPVDMEIIDKNGNVIITLADGIESEIYNNFGAFIVYKDSTFGDYIKMANLITDGSYDIRLKGKSDGTVSFSLSGYDNINDESINYAVSHIPVTNNTVITVNADIKNTPILNMANNGLSNSVQMESANNTGYIPVESLKIMNGNNINIKAGEKKFISAQTIPANATDQSITWSSSNLNIVSIENGMITGKSFGTAIITAKSTDGDKTATITINVIENNSNTDNVGLPNEPNNNSDYTNIQVYDEKKDDNKIIKTSISELTDQQKKLLEKELKNTELTTVGLGIYITVPTAVDESKTPLYAKAQINSVNGADPTKISYYRLNSDGTFTPVPTEYNSKTKKITIYANKSGIYVPIINEISFTDVNKTDWFYLYVNEAVTLSIVNGRSKEIFDPLTSASYADTVAMLFRAMGISPNAKGQNDDWSKAYIDKAKSLKIYDSKWKASDIITRERMAIIVANSLKMLGISEGLTETEIDEILKEYIDSEKISAGAKEAMAICIKFGLINGVNTNIPTIDPQGEFTRTQMATIAVRFRKLFINKIEVK